ncbi:MAG: tripartite tricarboxylate transporter TctB family protein [Bacillota bacterium]
MSDRILGLLAILVAGSMAVGAWGYVAPVEYEPVGPRAFPLLLAFAMAVCGGWLALRPGLPVDWPRGAQLRHIVVCAGAILAYVALFQTLGFVTATALMALPVGRVFGGSWRQCALGGIGLGILLYVLFDRLLDVVLPLGILHWIG